MKATGKRGKSYNTVSLNSKAIRYYDTDSLIIQDWDEDNVGFIIKTSKHGSIQIVFKLSTGKVGIYRVKGVSSN